MNASEWTPKFVFLLNAMERASWEANPSEHGYAGHRAKALDYVADLERKLRTAEAELGMADKAAEKWCQKALAEKWQAEADLSALRVGRDKAHGDGYSQGWDAAKEELGERAEAAEAATAVASEALERIEATCAAPVNLEEQREAVHASYAIASEAIRALNLSQPEKGDK